MTLTHCTINSLVGPLTLASTSEALVSITFEKKGMALATASSPLLLEAERQLREYFQQKRKIFDLPLAPQGTDFQQKVWALLLRIPFGRTISYSALTAQYGDPLAIRAVASANGKNPIPIIIPCHRVIGADGCLIDNYVWPS